MSVWTHLRKRFLPGQRVARRATIQLTLEELGARLAPGALLGGAGQTSLSFLGQPTASYNPPARVVAPAQIITAASVPAAPAKTTPAPAASNLQAPTGASLDNFSASALDGGSAFADSDSTTAPVAAPTIAASANAGNSGATPSPVVEAASPMSSPAPQNVAAPAASTGPDPALVPTAPPTVTFQVPDFVGRGTPQVSVTVAEPAGVPGSSTMQVHVDVDVRHDGKFNDPGDGNFGLATINGSGTISLTKPLASGTYSVRAWAVGSNGVVGFSAKESMVVDTNAGFVGSQPLFDLAEGFRYGTTTPLGGGTGGGENGGGGIGAAALDKDYSFLEFDQQGRVLVNVHTGLSQDLSALQSELQTNLGFTTTGATAPQNMVTGWLPVNQILNLPNAAHFAFVTPVYKPTYHVGAVTTQGDAIIKANTFRTAQGVNGAGVKVGVISNSVNQFNGGLASSVATGDLPNNVQVLQDGMAGDDDEGRAMLEIVHDVAPGSPLAFRSADFGPQDFAVGIQQLVAAGAKVITDDASYFDEPFFNDGLIAQAAENAQTQGVVYTTSAGNESNHGYFQSFRPITTTVGGVTGTFQDIIGNGSPLQTFTLGAGVTTNIDFQWDAAFLEGGSGTGNFAVNNDVEVLVTDATGTNILATFDPAALNANEAFTDVAFTNPNAAATTFSMSFLVKSGANPTMIRWVNEDDVDPDIQALGEGAPTSFGHEEATGVITTGAVDAQLPATLPIEPYSSLGGALPILFDVNGNRLAQPEIRNEPIVLAPDDVSTTFFIPGQPDGTGHFLFTGTSAATPHVAGAAALLLQQAPGATPAEVTAYLQQNAIPYNDPGYAGAGLIQLTGPLVVPPPSPPVPPVPPIVTTETESNQTSDKADDLGSLDVNAPVAITGQDITRLATGQNDYDWFRFTPAQAGTFAATESTLTGGNLELHLFTLFGNTLVELASSVAPGVASQTLTAAVAAGQPILVEVKGENSSFGVQDSGTYQLIVSLT